MSENECNFILPVIERDRVITTKVCELYLYLSVKAQGCFIGYPFLMLVIFIVLFYLSLSITSLPFPASMSTFSTDSGFERTGRQTY